MKIEETFAYKNLSMILNERHNTKSFIAKREEPGKDGSYVKAFHHGLDTSIGNDEFTTKGHAKIASRLGRSAAKQDLTGVSDEYKSEYAKAGASNAASYALKALSKGVKR